MRPLAALLLPAVAATQATGRALQHAAAGGGNACADLDDRTAALNDECCDEPLEECSSGRPTTCNLGCAHELLPFFEDCAGALGPTAAGQFDDVVALCHTAEAPPPLGPLPVGFHDSYTISGCSEPTHCGTFDRVAAHCTSGNNCPGGRYANGNTDPTLCFGAPTYKLRGGEAVLYRYYDGGSTQWDVGSDDALATCSSSKSYLVSVSIPGSPGYAPTASGYSVGTNFNGGYGWQVYGRPYCSSNCSISVVPGKRGAGH